MTHSEGVYPSLVMLTGTGVTGAGADHQIFTGDVPVPVWEGDGSVTRSHQSDVSVFSTHYERDHRWLVATTHPCRIQIGKAERRENRPSCLFSKKVHFHFLLYVYYTKLISEARWAQKPPTMGAFSCSLPFVHFETNRPQHTTPPSFEMRDRGFPFPTRPLP